MSVSMYVRMYLCMYVCVCMCVCAYVSICVCMCIVVFGVVANEKLRSRPPHECLVHNLFVGGFLVLGYCGRGGGGCRRHVAHDAPHEGLVHICFRWGILGFNFCRRMGLVADEKLCISPPTKALCITCSSGIPVLDLCRRRVFCMYVCVSASCLYVCQH